MRLPNLELGVARARLRAEDHVPDNGIIRWAETESEDYQQFMDDLPNHYQTTWGPLP